MERKNSIFGIVGILLGSIALLLSLTHFWAGPFSPQPTIETVVAEKAASIRSAALSALKGEEPIQECSGSMIPDTQIGGTLATQEVFNEKTTSFLYP